MTERRRKEHVGILILLLAGSCLAADGRQYKAKEQSRSVEQSSDEGGPPFSSELGEFFPGGGQKGSEEGFFPGGEFSQDFIPYSESRNATKYVSPTSTYHSVKDIPPRPKESRSRSFKDDPTEYRDRKEDREPDRYRKEGSSYRSKDESSYKKEDKYKKDDGDTGYYRDKAYRKSDSFRKDDSFRSKGPQYRSNSDPSYRRESSSYRRGDGHKVDDDRPPYKSRPSESRYRKDGSYYRSSEAPSSSRDDSDDRNYKGKRPIQTMYDDWSPEDDKPSYRDRSEPELSSEYDDSDYRERDDPPPPPPSGSSDYSDKEPRSKSIPTSMRPGPPYYSTPMRKPAESHQRTHTTSFGVRHEYPPPPTPQTFYAPSSQRKHDISRDFKHRKGEPISSKSRADKEWVEFKPSPPDPLQNSRSRSRDEYPQSEYSNPIPKKIGTSTQKPINRKNCVKLKKTNSPDGTSSKYIKKVATCYVCVDEKSGMNYEECSYESDSQTRPYVKTSGTEEAKRSQVSHRDKRDLTAVVKHSRESPTERPKREKDYYDSSKEEGEGYKVDEFGDSEQEKDASGSQEEESSAENCYKKRKGEMSCVVCQTPNKKGSYEQCSYESEPTRNKYEHSVEKVYGSPRLPESVKKSSKNDEYGSKEDDYDTSVEVPSKAEYSSKGEYPSKAEYPSKTEYPSKSDYSSKSGFRVGDYGEDSGSKKKFDKKLFGDSYSFGGFGGGFERDFFGDLSGEPFDFDSIPEPAETEGQFSTKDEIFNFKPEEIEDIDMSKNIGDFGQKNRSNCKKVMKNKMTCYQCVTSKGTKNEECMYLAEAEPESKHLSFSQVQEYGFDPLNASSRIDTDIDDPASNYGKRKFKKYHPDLENLKYFGKFKEPTRWPRSPGIHGKFGNAAHINGSAIRNESRSKDDMAGEASDTRHEKAREVEDAEEDEEDEDSGSHEEEDEEEEYQAVPTGPPEIDLRAAERGEFHEDTEPAWDPKLGISLPRYMLERSEHEAVFDEVLASG